MNHITYYLKKNNVIKFINQISFIRHVLRIITLYYNTFSMSMCIANIAKLYRVVIVNTKQ